MDHPASLTGLFQWHTSCTMKELVHPAWLVLYCYEFCGLVIVLAMFKPGGALAPFHPSATTPIIVALKLLLYLHLLSFGKHDTQIPHISCLAGAQLSHLIQLCCFFLPRWSDWLHYQSGRGSLLRRRERNNVGPNSSRSNNPHSSIWFCPRAQPTKTRWRRCGCSFCRARSAYLKCCSCNRRSRGEEYSESRGRRLPSLRSGLDSCGKCGVGQTRRELWEHYTGRYLYHSRKELYDRSSSTTELPLSVL